MKKKRKPNLLNRILLLLAASLAASLLLPKVQDFVDGKYDR